MNTDRFLTPVCTVSLESASISEIYSPLPFTPENTPLSGVRWPQTKPSSRSYVEGYLTHQSQLVLGLWLCHSATVLHTDLLISSSAAPRTAQPWWWKQIMLKSISFGTLVGVNHCETPVQTSVGPGVYRGPKNNWSLKVRGTLTRAPPGNQCSLLASTCAFSRKLPSRYQTLRDGAADRHCRP